MNKRLPVLAVVLSLMAAFLCGCGKTAAVRTVHCDHCGKELSVPEDSNMTDNWILYCTDCEKALGLDTIVPLE